MKQTLMLVALIAQLALTAPALADPREQEQAFPCIGRWQGTGRNTGMVETWGIDLVVHAPDAQGSCGTIEYTRPRCGGVLVDCRPGPPVVVREVYNHDEGCAAAGGQQFTCDGDTMQWAWHGWEVARTTLRRVDDGGETGGAEPAVEAREPPSEDPRALPPADRVPPSPPPPPPPPASNGERGSEDDGGLCGCRAVGHSRSSGVSVSLALGLALLWKRRRR